VVVEEDPRYGATPITEAQSTRMMRMIRTPAEMTYLQGNQKTKWKECDCRERERVEGERGEKRESKEREQYTVRVWEHCWHFTVFCFVKRVMLCR